MTEKEAEAIEQAILDALAKTLEQVRFAYLNGAPIFFRDQSIRVVVRSALARAIAPDAEAKATSAGGLT